MCTQCPGQECKFKQSMTRAHLLHHIKVGIPTKIGFSQLSLLPTRDDFLDPKLKAAFAGQVRNCKPLIFLPTSVCEKNDWVGGIMKYRVYLFGVLPCGSKTCVVLDNIDVHVDIMVPDNMTARQYDDMLRDQLVAKDLKYTSIADINRFRLHGFQKEKRPYKRVYFNNLQDRKKVIEFIRGHNTMLKGSGKTKLETAADDTGRDNYYFPKVAREYRFNTADWNRFETYTVLGESTTTNCKYAFRVNIADFKKLDKTRRADMIRPGQPLSKVIERDPTQVAMWDIETHTTVQNGIVPAPKGDYTIFMMCSAYFWHWSDNSLFDACAVNVATDARPGIKLVIECGTETNVLLAHMEVMSRMAPDIIGAFNGGNFDWPLYRDKLQRAELLLTLKTKFSSLPIIRSGKYADCEDSVLRWNFRSEQIKIDAETRHSIDCVADFPGMLDTDVLPIFLKLYPRAEVRKSASLNFFLAKNGLESKEDMPYKRMFRIYERALRFADIKTCHCASNDIRECDGCKEQIRELDSETDFTKCCYCGKKSQNTGDMGDVGYYCIIDCLRPQQLFVKRTIVPDKRELSNMSYVSLYDSFYRADGMKVCNLIGAYCNKRDIAFSNARSDKEPSDKDHYPGAWVFPPNRGLHSDGLMTVEVIDPNGERSMKVVRARPITGLDFASLYPSLMMAYNLSPDMIVYDRETAEQLRAEGYDIHHIEPFEFERGAAKKGSAGNRKMTSEGWSVRHNGIHNPRKDINTSTYYKAIVATVDGQSVEYKASDPAASEIIKSGAQHRVVYLAEPGREALKGENMGIFPFIVKKLFDKRVPVKREFVKLSKMKEAMDLANTTTFDQDGYTISYEDVVFNLNKVESKQKALKVLANTFYGKSGDYNAPIYELLVAAGVTCAGQKNIKKVAEFVSRKGFITHYGDTDSLYLSCPDAIYADCDAVYNTAMEELRIEFNDVRATPDPQTPEEVEYKRRRVDARVIWWSTQVTISMCVMSQLKGEVTDFLLADNGTCFLNMAYEEVLYPTVLCGKKKYFGTPHIEAINFYPKEMFIKGIDIVKQGQAGISKELGEEFIREATSPTNERELIDIAEDKIRKFYKTTLDPALFTLSARYRPNKRNVPVLKFAARMVEMQKHYSDDPVLSALYEPPEAGDKFEYVVVKKDLRYTLQGKKIELKKGDKMEFLRVYIASQSTPNPMEIDLNYYVGGSVIGLFARFIAYHEKFQPPTGLYNIDQYKELDQHCVNLASKYLCALCDEITGNNRELITRQGRDYRAIYTRADKKIRADLTSRYGNIGFIIRGIDVHATNETAQSTFIINQMKQMAKEISQLDNIGDQYVVEVVKRGVSIFMLHRMFTLKTDIDVHTLARTRIQLCDIRETKIIDKLYNVISQVATIISDYENGMIRMIDDMRKIKYENNVVIEDDDLDALNNITDENRNTLKIVYEIWLELIAVYKLRAGIRNIMESVTNARANTVNEPLAPVLNVPEIARTEARNAPVIEDFSCP